MQAHITPLILTYNEAPNIERCLERLAWAQDIVVIDSFSTDETLAIAAKFPQVRVVQRKFDTHAQQWNFGVGQITTPWVLAFDADYILPESAASELDGLQPDEAISAYYASFRYCIAGRPLRGTLYPPRAVLFRRDRCHYVQDGHTQRLQIEGATGALRSVIDHDDRKPLSHWLRSQDNYALLEVAKLTKASTESLGIQDRIRRQIVLAPLLVFVYTLLGKGLILDGWPGWYYVFQRTLAEIILSLRLLETKLNSPSSSKSPLA